MKPVVILLVITLVNAVPQLHQQENDSNYQLNPVNDEEAQQEAKEQQKRTLLQNPTYLGSTRHVGVHPLGFKYVLGYGPVGYYTKPLTVLKPVMQTHGWKPIYRVPVSRPVFKPIVPVKPVHDHHHHHHDIHPVQPVQPVQPVIPVHPEPAQPVIPVQKPVVPVVPAPTLVKPFVPLQPQLPYLYNFYKPLHFHPQVVQPTIQLQPPLVHQHLVPQHVVPQHVVPQHVVPQHVVPQHVVPQHVVPQPLVPQHPVYTPQFQHFVPQFAHQFPVPLPGVANPVGPIENTNSIHTSYSATFPKHPIIGVHTPPPAVPVHPVAQPPLVQHFPGVPVVPGLPAQQPIPIQPHLLHVIRHFPHLFKHITPLYPVNNPGETPIAELPKPIVPPATVHNPFNPQDNGPSVQIPQHLPEHPNYRPDIPNFYPIPTGQPDFQPDFQPQDNGFVNQQPQHPAPQTPLYLPPHPFLRQGGVAQPQEPVNSVQTELSATYPRNGGLHLPSISLEPPYRRSDDKTK